MSGEPSGASDAPSRSDRGGRRLSLRALLVALAVVGLLWIPVFRKLQEAARQRQLDRASEIYAMLADGRLTPEQAIDPLSDRFFGNRELLVSDVAEHGARIAVLNLLRRRVTWPGDPGDRGVSQAAGSGSLEGDASRRGRDTPPMEWGQRRERTPRWVSSRTAPTSSLTPLAAASA